MTENSGRRLFGFLSVWIQAWNEIKMVLVVLLDDLWWELDVVVHPSFLFLISWWLLIPSSIVFFWFGSGGWEWMALFCAGYASSRPGVRELQALG